MESYQLSFVAALLLTMPGYTHSQAVPTLESCTPDGTRCFYLYESITAVDWSTAYTQCQDVGMRLAVIESVTVQRQVERLSTANTGHAWVAGTRSKDKAWVDVNGRAFTSSIASIDIGARCAAIHSGTGQYGSYDCSGPQLGESHKFLCQYNPDNGVCSHNGQLINQLCYKLPVYGDVEIDRLSQGIQMWDNANQFCQDTYGGRLAHDNLQDVNLRDYVRTLTQRKFGGPLPVWIGIRREPWIWRIGQSDLQMSYTHWMIQEGSQKGDTCVHLDISGTIFWADKVCTDRHKHMVCDSGTGGPRPTLQSTTSTIAVPTTTKSSTPSTSSTAATTTPTTTPTTTVPSTTVPTTTTTKATTPTTTTSPTTTTATPPTTTPTTILPTTPSTTTIPTTTTTTTTTTTEIPTTPATARVSSTATTADGSKTTLLEPIAGQATKPQIESLYPMFGPIAGGTKLTITGNRLESVTSVLLGIHTCKITKKSSKVVEAVTPPIEDTDILILAVTMADGRRVESSYRFDYKDNPQITKISPMTTIKEGGTTLTVQGSSLDSVANPKIAIRVNSSEICENSPNEVMAEYQDDCNSTSYSAMRCRLPQMVMLSNSICKLRMNVPTLGVHFLLDGVHESHDEYRLSLRLSPSFEASDTLYVFSKNEDIVFNGRNVDSVHASDYSVDVDVGERCEVRDVLSDGLFCRPPQKEPPRHQGEQYHDVIVHAGANLHLKVGMMDYRRSLGTLVIVGIALGAMVLIAIIVVLAYFVIKKRRQNSKSKELLYESADNPMSDWPYEQRIHLPPVRTDTEETGTINSRYSSTLGDKLRVGGSTKNGVAESVRSYGSSRRGVLADHFDEEDEDGLNDHNSTTRDDLVD